MDKLECEVSSAQAWSNQWDIGVYERYSRLTPVKVTFVAAALVALIVGGTEIFAGTVCFRYVACVGACACHRCIVVARFSVRRVARLSLVLCLIDKDNIYSVM